jgi:hypothetical protein
MAQEGLVSVPSRCSATQTMERLLAELKKRDMTVFARVDHALRLCCSAIRKAARY